jgi:L,D-transpeptidase catalytic domain
MLFRLLLITLTCVAATSCSANAEIKVPQTLNNGRSAEKLISANTEKVSNTNTVKSPQKGEVDSFAAPVGNLTNLSSHTDEQSLSKGNAKPHQYSAVTGGNYMQLVRTDEVNQLGNPLYQLLLFANGQPIGSYITVSGRAYTQTRNRDRSGTEAPLPDGKYQVAKRAIRGTIAEAGDRFLAIQPQFRTGRTALGIHYDPSFEKNNGEDGTSGCIALTNREDLSEVLEYVRTYNPRFLEVTIR